MLRPCAFYSRGHGFNPWLGNEDPECYVLKPKDKIKLKNNNFYTQKKINKIKASGSHPRATKGLLQSEAPATVKPSPTEILRVGVFSVRAANSSSVRKGP